jgi:Cu(I)-responsive transcriptional regulator
MSYVNIGQAAAEAGVTAKMIRHYESLGLVPAPERTESGYRLYSPRDVSMLRFIRQARGLGFSMKQIESLMSLWRDDHRESREVKELAMAQLAELGQRQREIDQMKSTLEQVVRRCAGDARSHCAILESLADGSGHDLPRPAEPAVTLKQVKPGTRRPAKARTTAASSSHGDGPVAGLMAWSRSIVAGGYQAA